MPTFLVTCELEVEADDAVSAAELARNAGFGEVTVFDEAGESVIVEFEAAE
jgi:hypothetical protein